MSDRLPFFLREAQVSLWLADAAGQPAGDTVWFGGFLNRLRAALDYEEVIVKPSGAYYGAAHHVDEAHTLNFGQSWLIQKPSLTDWKPGRNQTYVLQLVWTSENCWLRRVYYGVTWRSLALDSRGTNQFLADQTVRAQSFTDDSGVLTVPAPQPPVPLPTPSVAASQPVGFFRESALIAGEYLLGFYTWSAAVTLRSCRVIAWAPQTAPVVLELEVNGALTGRQLTLPVGTVNTEVTDSLALSGVVGPGQLVRWKIISAPDPVDTAYKCQLVTEVSGS